MKVRLSIALAILTLLGASCSRKPSPGTRQQSDRPNVRVEQVARTNVEDLFEVVGVIRSATTSVISARTMGRVIAVKVREGDRVRAGQALIEIDDRDATTQIEKAQAGLREAQESLEEAERSIRAAESAKAAADAQYELASKTLDRYKALFERKSASPQEFDEVQAKCRVAAADRDRTERMLQVSRARKSQVIARIDQAKADIAAAQTYAGYARIAAPFNGIVSAKQVEVGQMATPGNPLLTVEDDSQYRLEASIEESKGGAAKVGNSATVSIDALEGTEFESRISEIVPASDPASHTLTVKFDLQSKTDKGSLRSGMFGRARFSIGQRSALLVPRAALVHNGQLTGVYVVDGTDAVRLALIKIGKEYGEMVEVLSGLNDGDRIVADRPDLAAEGALVN